MLEFVFGLFLGAFLGATGMCLLVAASPPAHD